MNLQMIPHYTDHLRLIVGSFCEPLTERERGQLRELVAFLGWPDPVILLWGIDGEPRDWAFPLKEGVMVNVIQRPGGACTMRPMSCYGCGPLPG